MYLLPMKFMFTHRNRKMLLVCSLIVAIVIYCRSVSPHWRSSRHSLYSCTHKGGIDTVQFVANGDDLHRAISEAEILIVGAGLSGAVLANLHATRLCKKVLVIETRDHIAGNCYDFTNELGIRVNKYGAHLFHTNSDTIWEYLSRFTKWYPYEHRVIGVVDRKLVPIPVSINTVDILFNQTLTGQRGMQEWLKAHQAPIAKPLNGEEAAKSRVGTLLYEKIFKHYTFRQWSKYPSELDASVLLRIPVRDNFDDRYFPNDKYQALPSKGYTHLLSNILAHSNIKVAVNTNYFDLLKKRLIKPDLFEGTFFTGPIDKYFESTYEKLEYRSINFETIHLKNISYYQPNSVVNYPQGPEKFTRIVEYKHFYNQEQANGTTIVREYSSDHGDPYYPVLNQRNRRLYGKYKKLAEIEERKHKVHFVGRLASYKYFNMDQAVLNALMEFGKIYGLDMHNVTRNNSNEKASDHNRTIAFMVNHCKKDLSWMRILNRYCLRFATDVYIYEKCGDTLSGKRFKDTHPHCNVHLLTLPNVGREGHTWLYHMLHKQFAFRDINVFLQAGKHTTDDRLLSHMTALINTTTNDYARYVNISDLGNHFKLGHSYAGCSPITERLFGLTLEYQQRRMCYWLKQIYGKCFNFHASYAGEFFVTETLLRRMLSRFRSLLLEMYLSLSKANNPFDGHMLERLWMILFRYPFYNTC